VIPLLFKLDDFCLLRDAGTGGFSRVFTVQHRYSAAQYALKALTKTRATKEETFMKIVMSEKKILAQLDSPFLIKMYTTFQDQSHLYVLLELVRGGDMRDFLFEREHGRLSISAARFFGANVVLAMEYLHERNIVYRDLKPENILVGNNGYLKIIDFGNSRQTTARCFTVCGTMDYLAPEVWLRKGHSLPVDWWAFGVFIYELIEGSTPFEFNNYNREKMLKRVLKAEVIFTSLFDAEPEVADLIRRLCTLKVNKRLGCTRDGIKAVKNHAFFAALDWESVASQSTVAPELPTVDLEFDETAKLVSQSSLGEESMHDRLMHDKDHYAGVGYDADSVFWVDEF